MSKIDLLSNWTDITYENDNIRFATTALNEIYTDYAVNDEIMLDKMSGQMSYKRKEDGQIIRPVYTRNDRVEDLVHSIMSCTQQTNGFTFNRTSGTTDYTAEYLLCYNYNLGYVTRQVNLFNAGNQYIDFPEISYYTSTNAGVFIRLNVDKDLYADLGMVPNKQIKITILTTSYYTSGDKKIKTYTVEAEPNKYAFIALPNTTGTLVNVIFNIYYISSSFLSYKENYNVDFWNTTQSSKNGGSGKISSIDFAFVQRILYDGKTNLMEKAYLPVTDAAMKSPGSADDSSEYIYPIKLDAIVPLSKFDQYSPVQTMNAVPIKVGTFTTQEEAIFCPTASSSFTEAQFQAKI
jgi:hypothetical protein